jgi:hypothetical protein
MMASWIRILADANLGPRGGESLEGKPEEPGALIGASRFWLDATWANDGSPM